jgi:hypothetical protein
MDLLRHIAIWVQETDSGTYRWVLTAADAGKLRDVRRSDHEFISFEGALDEGVDALKSMSADLKVGPREELEEELAELAR